MFSLMASAQVDPASSLLIRSTNDEVGRPNLDSSRYTVKPSSTPKTVKTEKSKKPVVSVEAPDAKEEKVTNTEEQKENKNIAEKVREIFLGGDQESISEYKEQLHAEDPRQNVANITVAPGLFYYDSSSAYWYRRYHSSGPGLTAACDIWVTPFMGVNIDYFTTLAAELDVDPTSKKAALVDHRYTNLALQFRKYATLSRKSPRFNLGIGFSDYQLIIPKEEANRSRISSSGLLLSFQAAVPKTINSAWSFGTVLYPKLKIKEERAATEIKSGTSSQAYGVKFYFGQIFTLDRHNQIFWRASHRLDKSVYSGTATPADPVTTSSPQGVVVTTGATLFEVGYTWGD